MKIAFKYLYTAFFINDLSKATEQLLWHITTIEALLGEEGEGITSKLKHRLANILGKDYKGGRKKVKELFYKIYKMRCNLVHGRGYGEDISIDYLYEARNLARKACIWFIIYLNIIINKDCYKVAKPTREDILTLIDSNRWQDDFPKKSSGLL
jgi:hypothetical protein